MKAFNVLFIGFGCFAILLGYITGISSSEISQTVLTALFAFLGGKLFVEFNGKDEKTIKQAGSILIIFSIVFFFSLNFGIYVKVNKLLTKKSAISPPEYLRLNVVDSLKNIERVMTDTANHRK